MERKRVEEFEESLMWRLWMNQSCITLGFISQNSLWKLSFFRGYKGIYTGVRMEYEESGFSKQGWLAAWLSREITERPVVLFCPIVLQLAWRFNFWHAWHVCCFWRLTVANHPRDQAATLCFLAHSWAFNHSISLTTLTTIPPKYRVTKCWNTNKFGTE